MRLSFCAGILAAALAAPCPARALDPHLPPDTQLYLALDLRKVFDSAVFKKNVLGPARETIKAVEPLEEALKGLGLDPFKDIDRVILASPGAAEADRGLAIVHGAFDAAKFKAYAAKRKNADDDSVKLHDVPLGGGARHTVYEVAVPGSDQSLFVAVASPKVLLASLGKDYVVEAIKQGRSGKKPVLKDKGVAELIERLDPKLPLALALPGKALAGLGLEEVLPQGALEGVEAIGAGLSLAEEAKLELAITAKEADNAKAIRDQSGRAGKLALGALALWSGDDPTLNFAYEVLRSLKIGGRGKVVSVTVTVKAGTLRGLFGKE